MIWIPERTPDARTSKWTRAEVIEEECERLTPSRHSLTVRPSTLTLSTISAEGLVIERSRIRLRDLSSSRLPNDVSNKLSEDEVGWVATHYTILRRLLARLRRAEG